MEDPSRRSLIGIAVLTTAAAGLTTACRSSAAAPAAAQVIRPVGSVADRRLLAAIDGVLPGDVVFLSEAGREGLFRYVQGTPPSDDPAEGLYVRTGDHHFARVWDGTHGRPEWFGAQTNVPTFDCADAIEACYAACPFTQLAQADYFIQRTLKFNLSWRTMRGVGSLANDQGQGTRIILQRAARELHTADIMIVGSAAQPSPTSEGFPSENHFSNFTLIRDGACTPHRSGQLRRYPAGLRAAYLVRSTFREIVSLESSVGFYIGGIVYTKFDDCLTMRHQPGTTARDDFWVGYYLDGEIAFGYAGGNASLYMNRCITVEQHAAHVRPVGLLARGAFVDTFLDNFESARIETGIAFSVDGARAIGQTGDVHIRNAVLDGCARFGIDINLDATSAASIEIIDPYIYAAGSGGDRGILVHDGAGLVTINGGQVHGDFGGGSLWFSRTRGVRVQGTKIQQSVRPIVVTEASGLHLEPQINNVGKVSSSFAITCAALTRSIVRPVVIGTGGPSFAGGISLGTGTNHSQFDGTGIDPTCFSAATPANKVWFGGADARGGAAATAFAAAANVMVGVTG